MLYLQCCADTFGLTLNKAGNFGQISFPYLIILTPASLEEAEEQLQAAACYLPAYIRVYGDDLATGELRELYKTYCQYQYMVKSGAYETEVWWLGKISSSSQMSPSYETVSQESAPEAETYSATISTLTAQHSTGELSSAEYVYLFKLAIADYLGSDSVISFDALRWSEEWQLACDADDAFTAFADDTITQLADAFYSECSGLAGYVSGSVYRSENPAQIVYNQSSDSDAIGGLVGVISGFVMDSENADGTYVLGSGAAAGGIVGRMESGSAILRCINNGARVQNTGDDGAAGGIVGEMADDTQVQYCGNIAAVTSSKSNTPGATMAAAGVAGRILGVGEVASCFNKGDVTCTGGTRGGILGYVETGYDGFITLCCNLSTQSGTWADADYVTATTDPAEAAYIMDNGGSERYEKWGWADGDSTPILVSNGATPVYKLKLTAVKSKIEALTRNYFTAGETVTL